MKFLALVWPRAGCDIHVGSKLQMEDLCVFCSCCSSFKEVNLRGIKANHRKVEIKLYLSSPGSHPKGSGCQTEVRSLNSIQASHVGSRGPSTQPIFYCLPRCISRELFQNFNSSEGVSASQAAS